MKNKKISQFLLSLVVIVSVSLFLCACSSSNTDSNNNYQNEEQQILATMQTSYRLVAVRSIDNTISFTNVLDKDAEIKIIYKFNNGVEQSDIVNVKSKASFNKTYHNGFSIASFDLKILSLN